MNISWQTACTALIGLISIGISIPHALAGEWDLSGFIAGELRTFPNSPQFSDQKDTTFSPSLALQPEVVYEWNSGNDRLTIEPFLRLDANDDHRTHADLREASWLHQSEHWDLVMGLSKVFWGVTESRHLVDIINQTDRVEDIDFEDKLGQPMVNVTLLHDWGALGLYVLPGFRERTFPDEDARLRGPLSVDVDHPSFEASADAAHVDFAGRWAHTLEEWDIGLAYFYGTSREPRFLPRGLSNGSMVLIPRYDLIHQGSLDLQYTFDAWLWKLEALTRSGQGHQFFASVAGFEYTFFQILDSPTDLGLLMEYQYDGRDDNPSIAPFTFNDDDIFLGTRLTLNDEQDSTLLAGTTIDLGSSATILFVEAERRLGDHWKLEIEARLFPHIPKKEFATGFKDDGFLTTRLNYFF